MKKILLISCLIPAVALGGCAQLQADWNSLSPAQKVQLLTNFVNGVCVASGILGTQALAINAIVHPNASTGGSGASAAGTITKVNAINASDCAALNGVVAAVTSGTATVTVGQ